MSKLVEVYTSFDNIRLQIIKQLLDDLGLSETDLHRGTFVSYLIDMLSHLTANILFYSSMNYRESFMTLAQLPDSVYNLSAFLGYKPSKAIAPKCDVLIQIPLEFTDQVTLTFPQGHKFYAGNIVYRLEYRVDVFIDPNGSYKVTIIDPSSGSIYQIPYTIVDNLLSFTVTTIQQEEKVYEFVSDPALLPYTFSRYDIEFEEQLSYLVVYVDGTVWTEFDSMYLMRPYDTGYVVRITKDGAAIFFGNGIFGQQPPKSVPIEIHAFVTLGEDGKVASGTIKQGDRIYYDTPSGRKILDYKISNPSSSIGGSDMEHIDDVRRNALIHMQALNRLVSQYDYTHFQTITGLPFRDSLAVLKRSDLKCNEIGVFTTIELFNDIVPTRTIPVQGYIDDLHLQPFDVVHYDSEDYIVLFEYIPDESTKEVHTFYYAKNVIFHPSVVESHLEEAEIVITQGKIDVDLENKQATFSLLFEADDPSQYTATIRIKKGSYDYTYSMTRTNNQFTFTIDLIRIPVAALNLEFKIYKDSSLVLYLTTSQIVKQSLEEIVYPQFVWIDEYKRTLKFMIPVIKKSWYEALDDDEKSIFTTEILQKFVEGSTNVYRMLNTSVNVLFANTTGRLTNVQFNESNYTVKDILIEPPTNPNVGDTYLVGIKIEDESNPWYGHENELAICTNNNPTSWTFISPTLSTIILNNSDNKKYIWNGSVWCDILKLQLPLTIEADVYVDTTDREASKIIDDVKDVLQSYFRGQFGIMAQLFRSELVRVIQSIPGVVYCKIKQPEFDIFFNFQISKLSRDELFEFSPDFIYFDDIILHSHVYDAEVTP